MLHSVRVITAPTSEPVTKTEAKLDARVDTTTEDTLFDSWIAAARDMVEKEARRALITRTLEVSLSRWPANGQIELPYPPLIAVTQITYYDDDNVLTTWSSSNYIVIADQEPGVVVLADDASWPGDLHTHPRIRVRYTAGYGAAANVPETYKNAIRALVKLEYDHRSGASLDVQRAREYILAAAGVDWGW